MDTCAMPTLWSKVFQKLYTSECLVKKVGDTGLQFIENNHFIIRWVVMTNTLYNKHMNTVFCFNQLQNYLATS